MRNIKFSLSVLIVCLFIPAQNLLAATGGGCDMIGPSPTNHVGPTYWTGYFWLTNSKTKDPRFGIPVNMVITKVNGSELQGALMVNNTVPTPFTSASCQYNSSFAGPSIYIYVDKLYSTGQSININGLFTTDLSTVVINENGGQWGGAKIGGGFINSYHP